MKFEGNTYRWPPFGDFLGWHPHLHVLCTDGCFYGNGPAKAGFRVARLFELKQLEEIFPAKTGSTTGTRFFPRNAGSLSKEKITEHQVDMLMKWPHSRFNLFCGPKLQHGDKMPQGIPPR
ncbi:MAG: transposase [Desulfobacteraceae bacterium]|uniref:Transposase n=1 Tax=Candidatus Desulfacyla euxinica TaxID=2841693 RepID=A0A8J6N2A0_9DELT|nr:transposase [Candidatus Desulfacyla euxinica]MBL6978378.1 transposase [Desulfobacteraceae bacterium]MBL7217142.1 transposase [Desulfobacteraceae bacterium]